MLNRIYKEIKQAGNRKTSEQRAENFLKEMRRQFDAYTERMELHRKIERKTFNSNVTFPVRQGK